MHLRGALTALHDGLMEVDDDGIALQAAVMEIDEDVIALHDLLMERDEDVLELHDLLMELEEDVMELDEDVMELHDVRAGDQASRTCAMQLSRCYATSKQNEKLTPPDGKKRALVT